MVTSEKIQGDTVETFTFIWSDLASIAAMTVQHIEIVGVGICLAILTGVPPGILITGNAGLAQVVLYTAAMVMTIPSVPLSGLMIPALSGIRPGHPLFPTQLP